MYDYRDKDIRALLMETLHVFGNLNENYIDDVVTIFHCLGKVDAGEVVLSQGTPYSGKWRVNMLDLQEEGLVRIIEKNPHRTYSLPPDSELEARKFGDILERLKKMDGVGRREHAIALYRRAVKNYSKHGEVKLQLTPQELNSLFQT